MGQIPATRNLVATKVVRHAGQWHCHSSNRTNPQGDVIVTSWQNKTKHSSGLVEINCTIVTKTMDQIDSYRVATESVATTMVTQRIWKKKQKKKHIRFLTHKKHSIITHAIKNPFHSHSQRICDAEKETILVWAIRWWFLHCYPEQAVK